MQEGFFDVLRPGRRHQFVPVSLGQQAAAPKHGHTVAMLGFVHDVGGQQDGGTGVRVGTEIAPQILGAYNLMLTNRS